MLRFAKKADDAGVDISAIRRENLRGHAERLGGQSRLSDKLDRSESHISQLIGRNPTGNIGNGLAREIEEKLGLPFGDLDQRHYPPLVRDLADTVVDLDPALQKNLLEIARRMANPR